MTAAVLTAADGDLPDIPGQPYVSPDDLASIGPLWQQAVQQQLVPIVAEVYQTSAGVVHAQMVDATQVPTLPSVGSLAAEQYLAAATNTFAEVGDDLWATARSELLDGFEKGESIDQLAARLRASAGMTAKKATLVARTQVLDSSNAGSIATARASGIDMQKEWMSAEDSRVRPEHVLANGQKVDLNAKFTVGGYECDRPHDPTLPPALRYSCRCTTGYLIPEAAVDEAVDDARPVPPIPGTSGVDEPLPDPYAGDLVSPALPGPDLGIPTMPGAGLTVRPALQAARTTGQVERVFRDEFTRITGRQPQRASAFQFAGSAATAREHAEGLLRGLERFPDAKLDYVTAVSMARDSIEYAYAQGGRVGFNYHWTAPAARKKYLETLGRDTDWDTPRIEFGEEVFTAWHPRGTGSPVAVAIHEFGHILDIETVGKAIRADLDALLQRRAVPYVSRGLGVDTMIRREVSGYATRNREELVTEAFADVMVNGDRASDLSKDIFTLLEAEYRRGGGVVRAVQAEALPSLPSPAAGLAARSVPQLRALAKERGITIPPGSKKADIVGLLDEGPGAAPVAAPPAVEVPLAKRTVAQLRALAAERKITVPKGAKKPDIVRLLEAPPLTQAEQRAAVRALARETNTLIEQTSATAHVLAEVDELLAKKASASTIREAIADALAEPGQLFAGADPAVLAALRAVASDPVKLRAAITRLGGKAKIKPVSKAGAKVTFDADTMEGVGGIDIPAGARVTVVRRGSTVTLPDGTVMQLEKARVTPVTAPAKKAAAPKKTPAKKAPAAKAGPASVRQPGVDLTSEVTPTSPWMRQAELRQSFGDPTDGVLTAMVRQQPGWSDAGRVVTQTELDRAVRSGWIEVWRGVQDYPAGARAAEIARATRTGDWAMGNGMYGNGVYTTVRRTTAEIYRGNVPSFTEMQTAGQGAWGPAPLYEYLLELRPGPTGQGGLIRMALDPNAKLIDYEDLKQEHLAFLRSVNFTGLQDTAYKRSLYDANFYAVMRGYDGVRVHGPMTNDGAPYPPGVANVDEPPQFIIFNRTVLIFERASRRYDT